VRKGAAVRFEIKRTVLIANRAKISIARPYSKKTKISVADFSALIESDSAKERIFVRVDYANLPPTNDFFVRVFINLPSANAGTPTDDPHFAGSFAFFGTHGQDHDHHMGKTEFLVYVTDTLQRLRGMGALRDNEALSVQLVAVPIAAQFARPDTELILEHIDLIVSPVHVRTD
jgi:tyrosinase